MPRFRERRRERRNAETLRSRLAPKINLTGVAGLEAVDVPAQFAIGEAVDVNEIVFRPTKQELWAIRLLLEPRFRSLTCSNSSAGFRATIRPAASAERAAMARPVNSDKQTRPQAGLPA